MLNWISNLSPDHWFSISTVIAIFLGPILAVLITRKIDDRRFEQMRKMEVFRTLMRTRQMPIHPDHVGALNLVEVEFANNKNVVDAWKEYHKKLGEPLPSLEEKGRHDSVVRERATLLTKLIHEISKVLNLRVQQLDILEGNYVPQGWHDDDWEQRLVRHKLIGVLSGRTPLTIRPEVHQMENPPYPPRPSQVGSVNEVFSQEQTD